MRVIAYVRVSTDRQAESGLGPEIQARAIREWARTSGHRIVKWCRDLGVSGSNGLDKRVGLLEAMAAVADHRAGGIVVFRLDRLARDLVLQESLIAEIWRARGRVFSTSPSEDSFLDPEGAETDPARTLIRQILGAVGEYERAMINLRLRAGRVRKRAVGGYSGGRPGYGMRAADRCLVIDADEQEAIAFAVALRSAGKSYRAIAAALTEQGYVPRRAKAWHPSVVRTMCDRAGRIGAA